MKMCTVLIRDQTAHSVHSDLDLHCPQKLPVLSSVRKDLKNIKMAIYLFFSIILHFTLHNKKKKTRVFITFSEISFKIIVGNCGNAFFFVLFPKIRSTLSLHSLA